MKTQTVKNLSKRNDWTVAELEIAAAPFKSQAEFKNMYPDAFFNCRKLAPQILKAMPEKEIMWNEKTIRGVAETCSDRGDMRVNHSSAYTVAINLYPELLDEIFGPNTSFTKEKMLKLLVDSNEDLMNLSDIDFLSFISLGILPKRFKKIIKSPKPRRLAIDETIAEIESAGLVEDDDDFDDMGEMPTIEPSMDPVAAPEISTETPTETPTETTTTEDGEVSINNITEDPTATIASRKTTLAKSLRAVDHFVDGLFDKIEDGQTSDALIQSKVAEMWNLVLDGVDAASMITELRAGAGKWLNKVIDRFEGGYKEVDSLVIPSDYGFKFKPNMMQKLVAHSVMSHEFFGNWSGPGAGKTNSFLLSASVTGRKMIVVICPNSVVSTIATAVDNFYNDSITIDVITEVEDLDGFVPTADRTFIVLNYEKFQQPVGVPALIKKITSLNPDMLVFDEIHRAKEDAQVGSGLCRYLIDLRKACASNEDLKVMGMTGTPLVNSMNDVKNIMELLSGKEYKEISAFKDICNCIRAHQALLLNGIRYTPKYPMSKIEDIAKCSHSIAFDTDIYKIVRGKHSTKWFELDKALVKAKFNVMLDKKLINPGHTIIYSNYVEDMTDVIADLCDEKGISYYTWTGDLKEERCTSTANKMAKKMDRDVIISSKPISTGVDGLQHVCDTIIIFSMPYTYAEYEQLVGRVYRQGSNFKVAKIYRLNITMDSPKGVMDLDQKRFDIVDNKKNLFKAVVDGDVRRIFKYDDEEALKLAGKTSKKIRKENNCDFVVNRKSL